MLCERVQKKRIAGDPHCHPHDPDEETWALERRPAGLKAAGERAKLGSDLASGLRSAIWKVIGLWIHLLIALVFNTRIFQMEMGAYELPMPSLNPMTDCPIRSPHAYT